MSNRRRPFQFLALAVFTASMGVIAFSGVASNPRFEKMHILDVIRLMAAGANFALTIVLLTMFFFRRSIRSEDTGTGK